MFFSVGILYSARTFLAFIQKTPIKHQEFLKQFRDFEAAEAEGVLNAAINGHWVRIDAAGHLCPTKRGESIVAASPEDALRLQLKFLIAAVRPPWAELLPRGREVVPNLPEDVRQCFAEAGLLDQQTEDIVKWWSILADAARGIGEDFRNETGRIGERLSRSYEQKRTGFTPFWQSLESSYAGYDLLSRVSHEDNSSLMIEVKTTTTPLNEATFYLSRNEWDVARLAKNYCIHLWVLKPTPKLILLQIPIVQSHIPNDAGHGRWKNVQIPFAPFC